MTSEERQRFMSQEFRRIFGGDPAVFAHDLHAPIMDTCDTY